MISIAQPNEPSVLSMATGNNPQPTISIPTSVANGGGGGGVAGTMAQEEAADGGGGAPVAAKQPSWWEKLLPTAGGVLGGIVGIPGDLLSGGAASVAGATGGAALGQMLENKLDGKSVLGTNDLTSGVENGVGDLVGLGAGKVVGALGEGLANVGTKAGVKAAGDAADEAATKDALDAATATKLNYGGISDNVQNMLDLGKNQKFVDSMGFNSTDPYDMQKVGQAAGELNNVYDHALQSAPKVQMGDFNKTVLDSMRATGAKDLTSTNSPVSQALADFTKKSGMDVTPEMDAVNVRQLQQAVGRQIGNQENIISNAELNGQYNADAHSQLNTLQDLYGQLGDKIKTPEVNTAIANSTVTDADRQGLVSKYGDKLGNHVADTIGNAKNADDLLQPLQQFTKMNKASQMAVDDIENVTASPRAVARAKFQATGGVAIPAKNGGQTVLDSIEAGSKATGHPAAHIVSAANKLHKAGFTAPIAKGMGTVLSKTAPLIAPTTTALANGPNIAAAGASAIPSSDGTAGASSMIPPTATGVPGAAAPLTPLQQAIANAEASMSAPGASLTPGYGSDVSALNSLVPLQQKNTLAADTVSNLAPSFANAGGAQGLGGGLLSRLTALIPGTAAHTYQAQQQAAAAQLAAILGISPQAAAAMLPQLMQSQQVAGQQQQGVNSVLGTLSPGMAPAQ